MERNLRLLYRLRQRSAVPTETAEPIVDLLNRGVSVAGIARERLTAKRSRPEMAPQRLEKIESGPGNGMGSEASNPQDVVHGRAADRARLRLTSRENDKVATRAVAEKGAQSFDFARCRIEIGAPARWPGLSRPSRASKARDWRGAEPRGWPGRARSLTEREHRSTVTLMLLGDAE